MVLHNDQKTENPQSTTVSTRSTWYVLLVCNFSSPATTAWGVTDVRWIGLDRVRGIPYIL